MYCLSLTNHHVSSSAAAADDADSPVERTDVSKVRNTCISVVYHVLSLLWAQTAQITASTETLLPPPLHIVIQNLNTIIHLQISL